MEYNPRVCLAPPKPHLFLCVKFDFSPAEFSFRGVGFWGGPPVPGPPHKMINRRHHWCGVRCGAMGKGE